GDVAGRVGIADGRAADVAADEAAGDVAPSDAIDLAAAAVTNGHRDVGVRILDRAGGHGLPELALTQHSVLADQSAGDDTDDGQAVNCALAASAGFRRYVGEDTPFLSSKCAEELDRAAQHGMRVALDNSQLGIAGQPAIPDRSKQADVVVSLRIGRCNDRIL